MRNLGVGASLPAGLEPATLRLTAARSSQLSYGRAVATSVLQSTTMCVQAF